MASNRESYSRMHYGKGASQSSNQSYCSDAGSIVDKENVEQEARMSAVEDGHKSSLTLSKIRGRKNSDNSFDRPLGHRGLQEIDNGNLTRPRRRIHSSTDADAVAPIFAKTRFTIYGEAESSADIETTGKLLNAKFKREKFFRSVVPLDKERRSLSVRRKREENRESNAKTSSTTSHQQSTSNQRASPQDLPVIPKPDVFKIKEAHRRASLIKRKQKQVYDVMSLELAYNLDYMSEYVRFQMEMNDKNQISPNFLSRGISADQRRVVVKYLIGSTKYYQYPSFVLYQAVKIFDFYIDIVDVKLRELQIAALASLWIALKKDLISDEIPEASMIIKLAPPVFNGNKQPLIEYERKILRALNFEISFSEPFSMLSLYTVMVEEVRNLESSKVEDLYYSGSYLIDLSLLLEDMVNVSAVHLAAISAEIAIVLTTSTDENLKNPQWSHWRKEVLSANPMLEKYRLPDSQMNHLRNQLLHKVIMSSDSKTDFHGVYKKYCSKRYGPISKFMVSKVSTLFLHKITNPSYDFRPIIF